MAAGDVSITIVEDATDVSVAAAADALWTASTNTFNYIKDGNNVWVIRQLNA